MRKLLSISLAALMLVLSLKMTVAVHYCDNEIAEAAFGFGKPGSFGCGMEKDGTSCDNPVIKENSCCKDHINEVALDTEYNHVLKSIQLDNFLEDIDTGFFDFSFTKTSALKDGFIVYRPPPEVTSVSQAFIQVFII